MAGLTLGHHEFSTLNGSTLTYTVRCSDQHARSPPIVVQCPGWGIGSRYLQIGLSPLEKRFKLVFFHPRGTNGSSRPKDAAQMSCFDMAQDLEQLRVHLGISRFPAIVGHSHGGAIALAYAEEFPTRVARMVLINHRLLGYDDSVAWDRFRHERAGDARYTRAYEKALMANPKDDREFTKHVRDIAPIYFHDPERYVPRYLEALGPDFMALWCFRTASAANIRVKRERKMIQGLKQVTAATLILFGKQDAQCTIGNLEKTQSAIPFAKSVILDQCGHFPWIEKPVETISAIKEFLEPVYQCDGAWEIVDCR